MPDAAVTNTLNDAVLSYLASRGYSTGSYNDRFYAYLGALGYTGSYNDRLKLWLGGANSINDRWVSFLGGSGAINDRQFSYFTNPPAPTDPYDITWAHSCWASDPLWTNPGDGNGVASWRNGGTVGGDPAQATGLLQPIYRSSVAAYNDKPAVQFTAASLQYLDFDITNLSQPCSLVVIGNTSGANALGERLVGVGGAGTAGLGDSAANTWAAGFTVATNGGVADADTHLFRAFASGAATVVTVDEVTVITGNLGNTAFNRLTLGAGSNNTPVFGNYLNGYIAFVGMASGNVTAQAGWTDFKAFAESFYGVALP